MLPTLRASGRRVGGVNASAVALLVLLLIAASLAEAKQSAVQTDLKNGRCNRTAPCKWKLYPCVSLTLLCACSGVLQPAVLRAGRPGGDQSFGGVGGARPPIVSKPRDIGFGTVPGTVPPPTYDPGMGAVPGRTTMGGGVRLNPAPADQHVADFPPVARSGVPAKSNWRARAGQVSVQTPGCKDCWIRAAFNSIEITAIIANPTKPVKSNHACVTESLRCTPNDPIIAFQMMLKNKSCGGTNSFQSYRYIVPSCSTGICPGQDEWTLAKYVQVRGPVVVSLDSSMLLGSNYVGGTIDPSAVPAASPIEVPRVMIRHVHRLRFSSLSTLSAPATCSSAVEKTDHAALLVGLEADPSHPGKYRWILKNSWGQGWGDAGYFYLRFGVNACGLANRAIGVVPAGGNFGNDVWTDLAALKDGACVAGTGVADTAKCFEKGKNAAGKTH